MKRHEDFQRINARFTKQYGKKEGDIMYSSWISKKEYNEFQAFPKSKEKKEKMCAIRGLEIKESEDSYHVEGLIATSHIDSLATSEGIDIADMIPKDTLEDFAHQINNNLESRVMGVHHSEGRPINPEYYGIADVENTPAKVIELSDGEYGLYVDTKLLKDDPETPNIIKEFENNTLNSFSITYDTNRFLTTDFEWIGNDLVRVLQPGTKLYGYTAASNPVNPNAIATGYGFKEFKELVIDINIDKREEKTMPEKDITNVAPLEVKTEIKEEKVIEAPVVEEKPAEEPVKEEEVKEEAPAVEEKEVTETKEMKEFRAYKLEKEQTTLASKIVEGVTSKMEIKEKVLKDNSSPIEQKESFELKEFREVMDKDCKIEIKEQFRRAGAICDSSSRLNWQTATTSPVESREYKSFGVNGTKLEFKGLGLTTNQNTDTDYLQSSAELQDIYDPVIYNALNQSTVTWNLLSKDDFSKKGNNQVQFKLKIAANASAAFYTGNAVATDNVTRLNYQTKFKKLQVGVSVDGDMIAAARGGPVSDVFAQEVMDSTMDMLAVLNLALFAEVGLESAAGVIGFEYITDSAGNTSLYNMTRSSANKLSPDSAADTYIDGSSAVVSMGNLRAAIRQAVLESANKSNLVFITNPVQADLLRGKFDDSRRMLTSRDTDFGFATDLFVDGVPVFEDKDCNADDWFLVDLETHRIAMWIPPTIEKLGKSADSEDAFIKMYFATYNRAPRRMVQIYGNATS